MFDHRHLKRLDRIWIENPVYFITTCVRDRRPFLAKPEIAEILCDEWRSARERHGWMIGRYVIMPDHVHFFCAELPAGANRTLSQFVGRWKEWTAKRILAALAMSGPLWQEQFFDHVLRSDESYGEKWAYVRENPVRAGLVSVWNARPNQGFVDFDHPLL